MLFQIPGSGPRRSILHDDEPIQRSQRFQIGRQDSNRSHQRSISYCNTPDLERSYSIESQSSTNEGPVTPPAPFSAYPDHFPGDHNHTFSPSTKQNELHSMFGGVQKHLPPIRTIVPSEAMDVERTNQFEHGRSVSPHIAHSLESKMPSYTIPPMADSTLHRSIEHPDDTESPMGSPAHHGHRPSPRDQVEKSRPTISNARSSTSKATKDGTIQKRYPCKFPGCGNTYTTSGHASRHAKSHGEEKLVTCSWPGCTKTFNRTDNMKQHYQTHTKEKKDKLRNTTSATKPRRDRAQRQLSMASSRGSARHMSPRESSMAMSPGSNSIVPSPSVWSFLAGPDLPSPSHWEDKARPNMASRAPSGLDTLAEVAAISSAHVRLPEDQQQQSPRQSFDHNASQRSRPHLYPQAPLYATQLPPLVPTASKW